MKKSLLLVLLFFNSISFVFGQTSTKSFYLELGGAYSTFQDVKYSTVSYSGAGMAFRLGFEKNAPKSIWGFGLDGNFGKENPNTHSSGVTNSLNPKAYARYLKKINDQFSVGVHWDVLNIYNRKITGLGNNGHYYITSSDLFATGNYNRGNWNFGLDLGLLSFQKESTSFSFSAPQNALENGDFDYQDKAVQSRFGVKYFKLKPVGLQLYLRTKFQYQWKKRIALGYQWTARHFAEVKKYPVTIGIHQLTIRYNIVHKTKDSSPENLK